MSNQHKSPEISSYSHRILFLSCAYALKRCNEHPVSRPPPRERNNELINLSARITNCQIVCTLKQIHKYDWRFFNSYYVSKFVHMAQISWDTCATQNSRSFVRLFAVSFVLINAIWWFNRKNTQIDYRNYRYCV